MRLKQTSNIYALPVLAAEISTVIEDSPSHQGPYAGSVDLAVPLGTRVLASADGVVARVRDDSDSYGDDAKFGQDVNYISISHPGGEISEYLHLAKQSSLVKAGEKIKTGQPIAETGLSGWLSAPHLHWMVYERVDDEAGFKCLKIRQQL